MPERKHFFFGRCSLTNIATGKTLPSIAPSPSPHHSPRSSVKCLSNYSYFFIKGWRHRNGWFEIRLACPVGCCTDEVFLRYFCIAQSINLKLYLLILNKLRRKEAKKYAAGSVSPRKSLGEPRNGQKCIAIFWQLPSLQGGIQGNSFLRHHSFKNCTKVSPRQT